MSLTSFITEHFGESVTFKTMGDHQSKVILVEEGQKRMILRLSKEEAFIERNFYALLRACQEGVSPKAIHKGVHEGLYFSLESFIEGEEVKLEDAQEVVLALKRLVNVKKVTPVPWKKSFFDREGPFLQQSPWYSLIEKKFPDVQEVHLIHGDLSFKNMIKSEKGIVFVDYQKAFFGEPEYDIGRLHWYEGFPLELVREGPWDLQKILFYSFLAGARRSLIHPEKEQEGRLLELKGLLEL